MELSRESTREVHFFSTRKQNGAPPGPRMKQCPSKMVAERRAQMAGRGPRPAWEHPPDPPHAVLGWGRGLGLGLGLVAGLEGPCGWNKEGAWRRGGWGAACELWEGGRRWLGPGQGRRRLRLRSPAVVRESVGNEGAGKRGQECKSMKSRGGRTNQAQMQQD